MMAMSANRYMGEASGHPMLSAPTDHGFAELHATECGAVHAQLPEHAHDRPAQVVTVWRGLRCGLTANVGSGRQGKARRTSG